MIRLKKRTNNLRNIFKILQKVSSAEKKEHQLQQQQEFSRQKKLLSTANTTSYEDMEELDFQILLPDNYYVNLSSIRTCFPMKVKKSTNEATDIDVDLITANNFFGQLVKDKHDKIWKR